VGQAKLKELTFGDVAFDEQTMDVWMKGVLASGHRRAALRELNARYNLEGTTDARLVFIDALKDGAFPNAKKLWNSYQLDDAHFFEDDEDDEDDEEVKGSFLAAMAGGAPCARTLRSVQVGEVTEEYFKALQEALPRIEDWKDAVKVVKKKTKK